MVSEKVHTNLTKLKRLQSQIREQDPGTHLLIIGFKQTHYILAY